MGSIIAGGVVNATVKWVVVALLGLHGLIHLMGFAKEWRLAEIKALTDRTTVPFSQATLHVLGTAWLVACLLLLAAAATLVLRMDKWWVLALLGIGLSQALIILWWNDARVGTIANVLLVAAVVLQLISDGAIP